VTRTGHQEHPKVALNLSYMETPWGTDLATKAWAEGDGHAFAYAAYSVGGMMHSVIFNWTLLLERGMLPAALITAITGCKFNNRKCAESLPVWLKMCAKECGRDSLRAAGAPLPKPEPDGLFTVYRGVAGYGRARCLRGVSWTGSLDVACWFACRFPHLKNPTVFRARVRPEDIYCRYTARNEDEYIVCPTNREQLLIATEEMQRRAEKIARAREKRSEERLKKLAAEGKAQMAGAKT
jgi:hypothetical protein